MSASTPSRWIKKPVVIEAIQWVRTLVSLDSIGEFTQHVIERRDDGRPYKIAEQFMLLLDGWDDLALDVLGESEVVERRDGGFDAVVYDRLHGTWVNVRKGDWIIRGVEGEFYPCREDVFAATYEAAP
ncbi:hypothetical protein FK530_22870 [Tsukamurella conjunctivitidis]|uniref:Uncharacterized protein n=1 Tax=Tsukamurella conjunctivitidis TaxID=2592068 RepID=A0A5C5RTX0_9ACTN|nr:hypothetical protein [Tsukamurella conjunctivitidis]TWS25565.1 hypothetical protein FK530_22870 [Tsukamurella conjunctivitidis]